MPASNLYLYVVFIAMVAWGFFHSWLASFSTKQCACALFGEGISRWYRLIFVGAAVLTLSPILAMVLFSPAHQLWQIPVPWLFLTSALQMLALVGIFLSFRHIDIFAFIGLRQLVNPSAERESNLVIKGMYHFVRHPLYFFSMVIFWLFPIMTDVGLAFVIASTLYFLLGTIPEEKKLLEIYGEPYRRYQEEVPRIIPGLKR